MFTYKLMWTEFLWQVVKQCQGLFEGAGHLEVPGPDTSERWLLEVGAVQWTAEDTGQNGGRRRVCSSARLLTACTPRLHGRAGPSRTSSCHVLVGGHGGPSRERPEDSCSQGRELIHMWRESRGHQTQATGWQRGHHSFPGWVRGSIRLGPRLLIEKSNSGV